MNFKRTVALGMTGVFLLSLTLPLQQAEAAIHTAQMIDGGSGESAHRMVRTGEAANLDLHKITSGAAIKTAKTPAVKTPGAKAQQKVAKQAAKQASKEAEKLAAIKAPKQAGFFERIADRFFFFKNDKPQQHIAEFKPEKASKHKIKPNSLSDVFAMAAIEQARQPKILMAPKTEALKTPAPDMSRVTPALTPVATQLQLENTKQAEEMLVLTKPAAKPQQKKSKTPAPSKADPLHDIPVNMAGIQELDSALEVPTLRPSPQNTYMGEGSVKVLKSGISTTMNEVDLTMGKAVVLNLSQPATRVSISDPAIANAVILSPTQIQLVGLQVGVANLLLWANPDDKEHTIIDISVHRDVSVLVRQLHFIDPGIQIVPLAAEDTVILTGEAGNRETSQLAVEMARAFFRDSGAGASGARSSNAPGTAIPGSAPNVINLIKVKGEPSTKVDLVRQKLAAIDPGIHLDIVPSRDGSERVILTGKVKTASMVSKAVNLASVFYGEPGLRVLTGPGGSSVREAAGNGDFQGANGFSDNKDINVLQGSIVTDSSGNVISMLEVSYKPQIRCSVQFLEVTKTGLESLAHVITGAGGPYGVTHRSGSQSGLPGRIFNFVDTEDSGQAFLGGLNRDAVGAAGRNTMGFANGFDNTLGDAVTQAISINEQVALAISALEENRKARSLAEPTLTMLSGEKASFLAGGEIPIAATSANGQVSIEFKEFGIRLNLVGTVTDDGKIHMQVAPEVSSIDPTINAGGFPGFRTRRMQSTLDLENHQSFIMAGLYTQDDTFSVSKFPWLGDLPIVGSFFRNKWNSKADTELVVVIKPEIVEGP